MKKITSKFHLGALTIVIQLWGDFFRRIITTWKSWPNVLKFQSIFILATDLPTLTILVWVSRFFNVSHGLSTGLPISRFLGKHFGDEVAYPESNDPLLYVSSQLSPHPSHQRKKSSILLQEWPCLNKEYFHPRRNGKKFRLIWNGKILNLTTFCRISRFFSWVSRFSVIRGWQVCCHPLQQTA